MTADCKSFDTVIFKLDSGSDFTTVSGDDLQRLGYSCEFLENCPTHHMIVSTAAGDIRVKYISNVSIKFGDREIYDKGLLILSQTENKPQLSQGEPPLQIYSVEENDHV